MSYRSIAAALLVTCMTAGAIHAAAAAEIRIGGAGTTIGTMKKLGEAYNQRQSKVKVTIIEKSLGAEGGVNALNDGQIEIGMSTRELDEAKDKKVITREIGRTPFVWAVAPSTAASNASSAELLQIYQLKKTTWDGQMRIRLVLRRPDVSDTMFLKDKMSPQATWNAVMLELEKKPGMVMAKTAQDASDLVEKKMEPGAVFTSTLAAIITEQRKLKALRIDGVEPTPRNVENGTYRYWKPVMVVTLPKSSPQIEDFIRFVRSAEGREILTRTGHAPSKDRT